MARMGGRGLTTVVVAWATLLARSRSVWLAVREAVLVRVPSRYGATRMVARAPAPGLRVPKLKDTPPPPIATEPWVRLVERTLTPGGKVSLSTTPVAAAGPRLV